ncbi:small integral membrane protein 30-like [Equus asinus]|uniref:small integral membrane protein 30-like n=1 Tax=Equus asinus TaxID=9793 RepID=UPI0038F66AAD
MTSVSTQLLLILIKLFLVLPVVEVAQARDATTLLLDTVLSIIDICTCLSVHA